MGDSKLSSYHEIYGSCNFGDRFGGKEGALRTYKVQASSQELGDILTFKRFQKHINWCRRSNLAWPVQYCYLYFIYV
jgi:hypothetical protein